MRVTWKHLVVGLIVAVSLSALFTFLALFDSDKMPFGLRFLFWFATIGVAFGTAVFATPWVMNGPLREQRVPIQLCVLAALISIPVPVILLGFDTGFQSTWPIANWALQYFLAFFLAIMIVAGIYVTLKAMGALESGAETQRDGNNESAQKFLRRLSPKFNGATLFAVSSEDHYLRVHTDIGDELILMRLSDAMNELKAADGAQIHRSWWVARSGVAEITGESGKQSLMLISGISAPIARSRAKNVRKALFK